MEHPHQEFLGVPQGGKPGGGVEFFLADFNQLRATQSCGNFLSLALGKPWENGELTFEVRSVGPVTK